MEWGQSASNGSVLHVLLRLQGGQATLSVLLPPSTSHAAAGQWLESLSTELAWPGAQLAMSTQPEALSLRIESDRAVTSRGFGQSRATLNLEVLEKHLRTWKIPALLAVRCYGADQLTPSLPAASSPVEGRSRFLFYRLGAAPSGTLVLDYGVNRRWLAAILSSLLLWLVFPAAGLVVVRKYLLGRRDVEPRERLRIYRKWQRGIGLTGSIGPFLTFVPLGLGRTVFLLGSAGNPALLLPVLWIWPLLGWGLTGRLVGLPIEREAFPQRKELPWYRAASTELVSTAVTGTSGLIAIWFVVWTRTSGGASPMPSFWALSVAPALAVILFFLAVAATTGVMVWRRKRGTPLTRPDAPTTISEPVRELSSRLDCPLERVVVRKSRGGYDTLSVTVTGKSVVVTDAVAKLLDPGQVAALAVAAALAQPHTPREKWITNGLLACSALPFLILAGMGLRAIVVGRPPSGMLNAILLFNIAPMFVGQLMGRRTRRRSEDADARVAEALPEPRRFLEALKAIEEELQADAGSGTASAGARLYAQRRRNLERRLGLAA